MFNMYYTQTEVQNDNDNENIGKIVLFDRYQAPSPSFPYYYLGEKSENINYINWPELVPYLYDKTLGFFTTINSVYFFKNTFDVTSANYSAADKILSLFFNQSPSINNPNQIILKNLQEDRDLYFFENGNYNDWNRTITPISNLQRNGQNILIKDFNYFITNVSYINYKLEIPINLGSSSFSLSGLTNQFFEFGIYRLPSKTRTQSIYYHALKGKSIGFSDNNDFIGGLRTRSQLMGHTHLHVHDMQHTHTMPHTHEMENHTHGMSHTHIYYDSTNANLTTINVLYGDQYSQILVSDTDRFVTNQTSSFNDLTNIPNNNDTQIFTGNSSPPNNTISSQNLSRITTKDDTNTTDQNFKIGNKTFSETYSIYPYIYGKKYILI